MTGFPRGQKTKALAFLQVVENTLGWDPGKRGSRRRGQELYVGKVLDKIATNPQLYTWDNLGLAVELVRRKRHVIQSPLNVFSFVEEAVELAYVPIERPLDEEMAEATRLEYSRTDPDAELWLMRLARAADHARADVLQMWRDAGRAG